MTTQHQAVVNATKSHFGERFTPGQDVKEYATKADKLAIATEVATKILASEVELSPEAKAKYCGSLETLVHKYVIGMVTNWFNKSKELNGNTAYTAKNPGSRAGTGDIQLREMRILRKELVRLGNQDGITKVDEAILARLAELSATSAKTEINTENLPAHLRHLVG